MDTHLFSLAHVFLEIEIVDQGSGHNIAPFFVLLLFSGIQKRNLAYAETIQKPMSISRLARPTLESPRTQETAFF